MKNLCPAVVLLLASTAYAQQSGPGADILPPSPPLPVYPVGSIINPAPTFAWEGSADESGIEEYSVELSTQRSFATIVDRGRTEGVQGGTKLSFGALEPGQTYYWRIFAVDRAGNASELIVSDFTIVPRTDTYTVVVTNVGTRETNRFSANTASTLTVPEGSRLTPGAYEWSVRTRDLLNREVSSSTLRFEIADRFPPEPVDPVWPVAFATSNATPCYTWERGADNVTDYTLLIGPPDGDQELVSIPNPETTSYCPGRVLVPGDHYWSIAANNAFGQSTATTAQFSVRSKVIRYDLDVVADPDFLTAPAVRQTGIIGTEYTLAVQEQLREGPSWFWRVTAVDEAGNRTRSAPTEFSIGDVFPPDDPEIVFPPEGGKVLNVSPQFVWQPANEFQGQSFYTLQVSESAAFDTLVVDSGESPSTSYQTSRTERLRPGATYFWRLLLRDARDNRGSGSVHSFTVDQKAVGYQVEIVRSDGAFTYRSERQTARTHDLPLAARLDEGVQYLWRVGARDAAGNDTFTARTSILLQDRSPPDPAVLVYPRNADVVISDRPGFTWQPAVDASTVSYSIVVAEDAALTRVVAAQSDLTDTGYMLPAALPRNRTYFWAVTSTDQTDARMSSTSAVSSFGISSAPERYQVEVSRSPDFVAPLERNYNARSETRFSTPVSELLPLGVDLYWRVRTRDRVDRVALSESARFRIDRISGVVSGGLLGSYFDGVSMRDRRKQRLDPQIDFPTIADANPSGDFDTGIGEDTFSVRWTGFVLADFDEALTFTLTTDDGHRLFIDGNVIIDDFTVGGLRVGSGTVTLTAGWHDIRVEMVENTGVAFARLEFEGPSTPRQVIPTDHLGVNGDITDVTGPVISDEHLVTVAPVATTVAARTNELSTIAIEYQTSPTQDFAGAELTTRTTQLGFDHMVTIPATPGALYYRVRAVDLNGNETIGPMQVGCVPSDRDGVDVDLDGQVTLSYFDDLDLQTRAHRELTSSLTHAGTSGLSLAAVGSDGYGARWSGLFFVPTAGTQTFNVTSDDGQRLIIDGRRLVNDWTRHAATTRAASVELAAGWHAIDYEYFQDRNTAFAEVLTAVSPNQPAAISGNDRLGRTNERFTAPRFTSTQDPVGPIEATSPTGTLAPLATPTVLDCRDPRASIASTAPAGFPVGTSQVVWTARNRFGEETASVQTVTVVDTTPPVVDAGPDLVLSCDAPLGDGLTPRDRIVLNTPSVTDLGDAAPVLQVNAPPFFPANTDVEVVVTARDASGNVGRDRYNVRLIDDGSLAVDAGPNIVAARNVGTCTTDSGDAGTLVRIRDPRVTGGCFGAGDVDITVSVNSTNLSFAASLASLRQPLPSGGNLVMQPAICVVDTDTRVEYVATLGAATGEGSFEIRLVDTSINVAVTNVTSGFTRNNGALTAEASYPGGTPAIDGPARTWDWTAAGDFPASATSQVDTDDTSTLAATFAFDGTYCPMNVIVTDEGGRMGVSQDGCFIIDRTRPRSTMQPVLTFASAADPRVLRTVDPADTSTYPQFFIGEDIPLDRLLALDVDGASSAGFGSVTVSVTRHVDQNSPTATELFSSSSASTFADGVFRTRGPTSLQLTCNDPAYCTAGALDLAKVDRGFHRLEIVTVDLAGNEGRSTQHMRVIDFADAATQASTWVSTLRADRRVPFRSALGDLGNRLSYARDTAKTAPGQAYALAAGVTTELASQQVATGSDDANFVIEYLPRGVVSDVRRVVEVAAEQRSGTWDILGPGQYLSSPAFNQTPVVLDVDAVVADAEALIEEAADAYDMKLYGDALAAARGAFKTLNIIGGEDINAIVYGRNAFTVDNGARLEGFYDNNDPVVGPSGGELQAVGRFVVASVAQQVVRARQPAAFASVVRGQTSTAFSNVEARLNTFAAVMQKFPNFNVSNVRTGNRGANQELMEDGYLAVSSALASMADVQGAAFDTGSWRAGLALGLGYIMEFSFFDGTRVISSFRTVSPSVRTFECRFNSIMRDIAENDVDNALDKFDRSTCLLIDTYNEFYPVGTLNVTDRIPDDNCIAPDAHGCPVSTRRFPNGCLAVDQTALVASGRDTSWDPELVGNCGALASCGNGVCDNGETTASCIADCP